MEKSPIVLLGNKPVVAMDTLTDKDGRFTFTNVWPVDTAIFKLQARNKKSKEYNVTIKMDEQTFPEFKPDKFIPAPWYVNTDTTLLNNAVSLVAEEKAKKEYKGEGMELREVNIKAKKIVKGSKNLNGPGEADLVLDEQDIFKAGKKTLAELLKEKIPEIQEIGLFKPCMGCKGIPTAYLVYGKKIHLVIDGLDVDKFNSDLDFSATKRTYIKDYLDYYTAEDITGIEYMFNPKYGRSYARADFKDLGAEKHAFIEITTRTGHGPFMQATPGAYLYKPLAFVLSKQFYSPKYTATNKNTAVGTDMRSTIFWEPNIITDAAGKATVSFYSADKAADYSVIIEGTDMSGGLGFSKKSIQLKQ
jgi:hypothetical protein